MNFKAFKDDDFSIVQDNIRLFFDGFGIYKGDFFTEWVGKIVEKWTGSKDTTFQQLYDKTGKDVFSKERTFLHTSFVRFHAKRHLMSH